jgi:hypothetical protein
MKMLPAPASPSRPMREYVPVQPTYIEVVDDLEASPLVLDSRRKLKLQNDPIHAVSSVEENLNAVKSYSKRAKALDKEQDTEKSALLAEVNDTIKRFQVKSSLDLVALQHLVDLALNLQGNPGVF